MQISESNETYLEAIYTLKKRNGVVISADIAKYLDYSKASVSIAMKDLLKKDYISIGIHNTIDFTPSGREIGKQIHERRSFFFHLLTNLGMNPEAADHDAHRLMHAISTEGFKKMNQFSMNLL